MPDSRAIWAAALANELDSIADDHAAFRWAVGAVTASYKERVNIMKIVLTRTFLAACLGVVHAWIAVAIWGYLAAGHNPIAYSLIPKLRANGHDMAFWLATGVHDVTVNIVIALPFAALLFVQPGTNKWKYAAVAGVADFLLAFWGTFAQFGMSAVSLLFPSPYYSLGNAAPLLSLPIAFAAIRMIHSSTRSRHSNR
jgi:hypothetical protein